MTTSRFTRGALRISVFAMLCVALNACADTKCPAGTVEQAGVCVLDTTGSLTGDGGPADREGDAGDPQGERDSGQELTPQERSDAAMQEVDRDAGMQHDPDASVVPDAATPDASDPDASAAADSDAATDAAAEQDAAMGQDSAVADPCDTAGCDPVAECNVVDDAAVCTCPLAYTGDGLSCVRDYCLQLDGSPTCGAHSLCTPAGGAAVSCECELNYGDCDDSTVTLGCETLLTDAKQHCGECGLACVGDVACVDGACEQAVSALIAGDEMTCTLLTRDEANVSSVGHKAKCWGRNTVGADDFRQLGDASFTGDYSASPRDVTIESEFRALSVGTRHRCAIDAADPARLHCWGNNHSFQLGTTTPTVGGKANSLLIPGLQKVVTGRTHTCALADGAVLCWGANDRGQLGTGSVTEDVSMPQPVYGVAGTVVDIASAGYATCAAMQSGRVFCWPNATDYAVREVLDTASQKSLEGVRTIQMQSAIDEVDYSYFTACGRHDSGAMSCWGRHEVGLPGIGARTPFWSQDMQMPPKVTQVAVGARHVCMLTTLGNVHCLGDVPSSGALGLPLPPKGTTYDKPTLVPGLDHVIELVAGSWHTCVRRATGQVQCFGRNGVGELGNGGTLMSYQPVNVVGLP